MLKTLKTKISLIYFGLVAVIAIVGSVSVYSLFQLSGAVDGLMTHNYKSIKAVANMDDVLEKQNNSILLFLSGDKIQADKEFIQNQVLFQRYFSIEKHNITESGEKECVNNLKSSYNEYLKRFAELKNIPYEKNPKISLQYYNEQIIPLLKYIKGYLEKISNLNEKAMFRSKEYATKDSVRDMYLLLFLSIFSVVGGFLVSTFFINRFLKPLRHLTRTMKLVREGDLNQQALLLSSDEIGELAVEFNNMTKRLHEYEKSSIGKLTAEKNKSLALVKSISDPLIVMNTNFLIQLINNAFERFFNVIEDKALNRHFFDVIEDKELFEYISSSFITIEEFTEKIICIRNEEIDFYYNVIVTKVRDNDHKINGIVVTFHNVTQLKQLDIVKTDFLSTISHELKTPLTSIIMGTGLLDNESIGQLSRKQKNIISTIKEDSERLLVLVNNLLELSRIESGKAVFNMKFGHIERIIENSMKIMLEQARNKGVKLSFEFEDELPAINIDSEKILWVLNNLIINALKYSKGGESIFIKAYERESKIFISIKDNGVGIPKEYQKKIFEKFIQVKGQDMEIRGTGLGLAIVKEIVEVHGGEIWCESAPEEGSTFTFTLPLASGGKNEKSSDS
ncbi:MAG: ATP-binding protein [Bacteroidota bacterium]|nr:ATP-binding protein [Bacteroidota bacterium]